MSSLCGTPHQTVNCFFGKELPPPSEQSLNWTGENQGGKDRKGLTSCLELLPISIGTRQCPNGTRLTTKAWGVEVIRVAWRLLQMWSVSKPLAHQCKNNPQLHKPPFLLDTQRGNSAHEGWEATEMPHPDIRYSIRWATYEHHIINANWRLVKSMGVSLLPRINWKLFAPHTVSWMVEH